MGYPYTLSLKKSVNLLEDDGDLLLIGPVDGLRFSKPEDGLKALLANLSIGKMAADELVAASVRDDAGVDLALLYYMLTKIEKKSFLKYTLTNSGKELVTLEPVSPAFCFDDSAVTEKYRLSRFACLRCDGGAVVVESPLSHARLVLHDARLSALVALLAVPHCIDDLTAALPDFNPMVMAAIFALLANAGVVFRCDSEGRITEDVDEALRQWEFHDLFFHTRSRSGRHEYPLGGTFRFKDKLPHTPAMKPPMSKNRVELYRPASDIDGPRFFEVVEARRSRCEHGESPMTLDQLGEFLWRSARVKSHCPADPEQPGSYESTLRPYPSGGAMHELELYLTVSRCDGLEQGLYHYDPMAHELERLAGLENKQKSLVQTAMNSSGLKQPPDVLITLAARFGRGTWKYEGVAYALTQKNVGCLYQQMYLVATALGLSPCALGAGDSDAFSQAADVDYFAESSVGEFMLSSAPHDFRG